ncbi:STAS domain-containing protein [Thalassobacillus sp. C254]|uniref:STAS domain-containing protein n=1 Tax=Thalassobacillus sp. C254 TaxID=1225341 RepID=UPI0006D09815|nr:STAS domain-containing protein [Thalassobacillus sp. C254]
MDDERSEYLQSKTLDRAAELSLTYIIIDLSGINTINTWFAQHLLNLIHSLQLLGIETSITGMRPELSQTIVHLGITFKGVPTYLTLEQALSQSPYMK